MAWSSRFIEAISQRQRQGEVWVLEVYASYLEPSGGDGYLVASARGVGTTDAVLLAGPPSMPGARLAPSSWTSTTGQIVLGLAGDGRALAEVITRGTICRVLCGFPGWQLDEYEVVGWGMCQSLRGRGGAYELVLDDALAALGSGRFSTEETELFSINDSTTLLNGAITDTDTTLTVDSTTGFIMDSGGSGLGMVKVEDEYITYTGTTATTFTGCTRGALGTTAAAHADNTTVEECAILRGHPVTVALRLLLSHGETGNSEHDDYDRSWGWCVRQTLVDIDDAILWRDVAMAVASGTYRVDIGVESSVDAPLAWLTGILSRLGMYITTRMGLLTVRGATSPFIVTTPPLVAISITDDDIGESWDAIDCEAWSADQATEYETVRVVTFAGETSTSEGDYATLPGTRERVYDVSDIVFDNEGAVRNEIGGRVTVSDCRVAEALVIRCAGMRLAQLAPGDVCYLDSARAGIRWRYDDGISGRRVVVLQVSPDWTRNEVTLRLAAYPATTAAFEP